MEVDGDAVNKVVGFGSSPSVRFYSPVGRPENDHQVRFGVEIDDSLGATTTQSIGSIKVSALSGV